MWTCFRFAFSRYRRFRVNSPTTKQAGTEEAGDCVWRVSRHRDGVCKSKVFANFLRYFSSLLVQFSLNCKTGKGPGVLPVSIHEWLGPKR